MAIKKLGGKNGNLKCEANFASKLIRQDKNYHEAIKISADYYKVDKSDLRSAMSQRSGLNRKGKRKLN